MANPISVQAQHNLRTYVANPNAAQDVIPDGFTCPISREVMVDPTILTPCCHTMERANLQAWVAQLGPAADCPACRVPIGRLQSNYALKDAIEEFATTAVPHVVNEQMQKTVYRDALAQDVQQLAGEIVQRNARITTLEGENGVLQTENGQLRTERDAAQGRVQHLEGENGELRTENGELRTERDDAQAERDVVRVANRTLTVQRDDAEAARVAAQAQRDVAEARENEAKIQLGMRRVDDLNADIQKASTSISRKGAASLGTVVTSAFGIMSAPMAGGIVAGPPGFIVGLGAAFSGLAVADKIDESQRRTKEEKLQKEQEKLALEAHIRNLRAQQRV